MRCVPFCFALLVANAPVLTGQSPLYLKLITRAGDSSLLLFRHANVRELGNLKAGDSLAADSAAKPIYAARAKISVWLGDLQAASAPSDLAKVHDQVVGAVAEMLKASDDAERHAIDCRWTALKCDETLKSSHVMLGALGAEIDYIQARNRMSRMITDMGGKLDSLPNNYGEKDDPDPRRRP